MNNILKDKLQKMISLNKKKSPSSDCGKTGLTKNPQLIIVRLLRTCTEVFCLRQVLEIK